VQSAADALGELPLTKRTAAARRLIEATPGMSAEERAEVVAVAVWPQLCASSGSIIVQPG
jgi:hypothetical protein